MRTSESIRSSFSGIKHQKTKTIIESEILAFTEKEVDCMIEIAQRGAYNEALEDAAENVELDYNYDEYFINKDSILKLKK